MSEIEDEFDPNFDHTKLAGEEIDDPWDDVTQGDWTNRPPMLDVDEDGIEDSVDPEIKVEGYEPGMPHEDEESP